MSIEHGEIGVLINRLIEKIEELEERVALLEGKEKARAEAE